VKHDWPQIVQDLAARGVVDAAAVVDRVHIVYGFSKDFCMNGLRVGLLYSRCVHCHIHYPRSLSLLPHSRGLT
jgi:hypothetical protein